MFTSALTKFINYIFNDDYKSLDHYIAAHEPQSVEDVERLEREYNETKRRHAMYPFSE